MDVLITKLITMDKPRLISLETFINMRPSLLRRITKYAIAIESILSADEIITLSKKRTIEKIFAASGKARESMYLLHASLVLYESLSAGVDCEIHYIGD